MTSMLHRRLIAAVALAALALLGAMLSAAPAAEAKAKIATGIKLIDAGISDDEAVVFGKVTSPRKQCRGNREVVLLANRSGTFKPADRARSTVNGGWLLLAQVTGDIPALKVKVKRKKLRNGDVCKAAAVPATVTV